MSGTTLAASRLADLVLIVHAAFVAFVVGGLAVVWLGNAVGWRWVNARAFRLVHLGAIFFVVAESWLGVVCPLTALEGRLRARAGAPMLGADESFVGHWLSRLLYWDAPAWVFTAAYTGFALLVLATWWRFPPRARRRLAVLPPVCTGNDSSPASAPPKQP